MQTIAIPYHTAHMELRVAEENLEAVITGAVEGYDPGKSQEAIVREALDNPVGTPALRELARGKDTVVLVTSDHTRAMPSAITLPILLAEIRAGNPRADITILIGTGLHRPTTEAEQRAMFGDAIVDNEKIVVNDAYNARDYEYLGALPSGAVFYVHKLAVKCDLLVTEGFIEPHFFAGFSGGRKSVFPGICSAESVSENHSFAAIASPYAVAGVLENNPVHIDMVHAARKVNVGFICNVALNADKQIIAAFAGDLEEAHLKGCEFVRGICQAPAARGDIVVTSNGGYPLDQNLYQTSKGLATAEGCAAEGAVIVMCAACADGVGGEEFGRIMLSGTPDAIHGRLAALAPTETVPEQWNAQIHVRVLRKHPVIFVTDRLDHALVRRANMTPASNLDEAMEMAFAMKGKDARVVVVPDGVSIIVAGC